jgi:hypothetical protein
MTVRPIFTMGAYSCGTAKSEVDSVGELLERDYIRALGEVLTAVNGAETGPGTEGRLDRELCQPCLNLRHLRLGLVYLGHPLATVGSRRLQLGLGAVHFHGRDGARLDTLESSQLDFRKSDLRVGLSDIRFRDPDRGLGGVEVGALHGVILLQEHLAFLDLLTGVEPDFADDPGQFVADHDGAHGKDSSDKVGGRLPGNLTCGNDFGCL